jgi:hypothetical protein
MNKCKVCKHGYLTVFGKSTAWGCRYGLNINNENKSYMEMESCDKSEETKDIDNSNEQERYLRYIQFLVGSEA